MPVTNIQKGQLDKPHYAAMFFATGTSTGGQVIATTQIDIAFNQADTNNYGISAITGTNAYFQVARDGVYAIDLQINVSDASTTTFIVWLYISTDNGTTFTANRQFTRSVAASDPGQVYSWKHWLPAGARIRFQGYSSPAVRIASITSDYNARFYAGPKVTVTEIR